MKWVITAKDADAIAEKMQAVRRSGTRHEFADFVYNGKIILSFGIRRGSGEKPHFHVPFQMKLSQKECRLFRECSISLEKYVEILKAKRVIVD